jgi:hypothetical protein
MRLAGQRTVLKPFQQQLPRSHHRQGQCWDLWGVSTHRISLKLEFKVDHPAYGTVLWQFSEHY